MENYLIENLFYHLRYYNYYIKKRGTKKEQEIFYKVKKSIIFYLIKHKDELGIDVSITHLCKNYEEKQMILCPIELKHKDAKMNMHIVYEMQPPIREYINNDFKIIDIKDEPKLYKPSTLRISRFPFNYNKMLKSKFFIEKFYFIYLKKNKKLLQLIDMEKVFNDRFSFIYYGKVVNIFDYKKNKGKYIKTKNLLNKSFAEIKNILYSF